MSWNVSEHQKNMALKFTYIKVLYYFILWTFVGLAEIRSC